MVEFTLNFMLFILLIFIILVIIFNPEIKRVKFNLKEEYPHYALYFNKYILEEHRIKKIRYWIIFK